jgi:hypothetical protein
MNNIGLQVQCQDCLYRGARKKGETLGIILEISSGGPIKLLPIVITILADQEHLKMGDPIEPINLSAFHARRDRDP